MISKRSDMPCHDKVPEGGVLLVCFTLGENGDETPRSLKARERSFRGHDAPAEHVRMLPQGPLGPPAPRGPRVEPRGARAGRNRARRVARAVPGGEAHRTKMGDVHAGISD